MKLLPLLREERLLSLGLDCEAALAAARDKPKVTAHSSYAPPSYQQVHSE
jgi:hypothetical protein